VRVERARVDFERIRRRVGPKIPAPGWTAAAGAAALGAAFFPGTPARG
jgi:hypothetical protein